MPLHAPRGQHRDTQPSFVDHLLDAHDVRLQPVLKKHADAHGVPFRGGDHAVDTGAGDVERLLDQCMKPAFGGGDRLLGMHA